jgi:hypothetical protein
MVGEPDNACSPNVFFDFCAYLLGRSLVITCRAFFRDLNRVRARPRKLSKFNEGTCSSIRVFVFGECKEP